MKETTEIGKTVVYQVFTRLFGNTNSTNKPWGTIEENGVGKFSDFTQKALKKIKDLGVTHIWYTGIPHHALIGDYTTYNISNDYPEIVKGRAGSPYAVKDYYSVNPDLANNPDNRNLEFKDLLDRSHKAGLKVIIDIVPNHIARKYEGKNNPKGVLDFGTNDNTNVVYAKDNNFYYNPGESFSVPDWRNGYLPLGGEKNNMADGRYTESPAKWTGNGSRLSKPDFNDWYETVKINYGIGPDGHRDFHILPEDFGHKHFSEHFEFWKNKEVPDSWIKFRDIAQFWLDVGVDGFRYDMAEMVPVEFWSFMNSSIKMKKPDAFLMAEVYNPKLYREYIFKGKMDYLYDKVEFYDSLKHIMQGHGWTDHIPVVQNGLMDIEHQMLHFLENHDEQRIASPEFLGNAEKAKPGMVVSATISTSPTMIYFGQEVGEPAAENPGFGSPSRTSIFDYVGVPHFQRWVNNKKFDGGQLSPKEKELRLFYRNLLNFTINSSALMGKYKDIHFYNKDHTEYYNHRVLSFVRWSKLEKLIIISNFDADRTFGFDLKLPREIIGEWGLRNNSYLLKDELFREKEWTLSVENEIGHIRIDIQPLESLILSLN
ncbi:MULTISPECIES: alpha-amylase family protein [unclassified Arenibacter]|uniref:alpha-amylase family protein n=1 Tax=unclassified Arenibacter TaxID=2615047 RepID=UPI000E346822|nr:MULTISPECIES: alpha-amylase family protein [unclassified Arenibacter]MCM4163770.1 alpha-amylase [Arenibacter sp. A80]RFT56487.1 alpha-amylase [Arenibacter sp. P308M17]